MIRLALLFLLGCLIGVLWSAEAIPGATAEQWLSNADAARKGADKSAEDLTALGTGAWAAIAAGAITLLGVVKAATPIIARVVPVWGPLVEGVANLAWHVAATPKQKEADRSLELIKQASGYLAPALDALRSLPPGTLPEHVQQTLNLPIVRAALDHLNTQNERA